ncbi:hypothetical protein BKA63DRAFT_485638 [Paraphoma chrysanthemicola]|nr:hypothetical protein BKA63DRAFT_485638 [Paraphoma chrysanthemicola]
MRTPTTTRTYSRRKENVRHLAPVLISKKNRVAIANSKAQLFASVRFREGHNHFVGQRSTINETRTTLSRRESCTDKLLLNAGTVDPVCAKIIVDQTLHTAPPTKAFMRRRKSAEQLLFLLLSNCWYMCGPICPSLGVPTTQPPVLPSSVQIVRQSCGEDLRHRESIRKNMAEASR